MLIHFKIKEIIFFCLSKDNISREQGTTGPNKKGDCVRHTVSRANRPALPTKSNKTPLKVSHQKKTTLESRQ